MIALGRALGIGLPTLVAPPPPRPVTVTRAGHGAALWTGENGGRVSSWPERGGEREVRQGDVKSAVPLQMDVLD